jgi:hypothetical protein
MKVAWILLFVGNTLISCKPCFFLRGIPFFQMMELARHDFNHTLFIEVFIIAT